MDGNWSLSCRFPCGPKLNPNAVRLRLSPPREAAWMPLSFGHNCLILHVTMIGIRFYGGIVAISISIVRRAGIFHGTLEPPGHHNLVFVPSGGLGAAGGW
jgi:hypothetical protein